MTQDDVVMLMRSSQSEKEWNENCDKVKKVFDGLPGFWYSSIILEGIYADMMGRIRKHAAMIDRQNDQS